MKNLANIIFANCPTATYASGKNEILMKCPFCGDSPDPKHKHFYISLKEGQPHFYNCFKCNESGIVTAKTLQFMSIHDMNAILDLELYNKTLFNTLPRVNTKTGIAYIKNIIEDNELSKKKLLYINTRLGLNLSLKDLEQLKICLNLYDILNINRISKLTRDPRIVNDLNNYFIGFISTDNNFITMRNLAPKGRVNPNIDRRYNIYNIFNVLDNSKRFYTIPTSINPTMPVNIHIAEGPFDILSAYYNLERPSGQNIYAAVCGKAYLSTISYFITELGLFNSTYHIYIDNDISNYELRYIGNRILPLNSNIYIHRNVYPEMKDFGVKRDYINEQVYLLRDIMR